MDNQKNQNIDKKKQKEIDKFATELAKKISKINPPKRTILGRLRINPLIILVSVFLLFFLLYGFFSSSPVNNKIQLGELISGLKEDRFSQLIIQNDGSVVAKEKSILVSKEALDLNSKSSTNLIKSTSVQDESLKKVDLETFINSLTPESLIDRIRLAFRKDVSALTEIIIGNDYIIGVTTPNTTDILLEKTTEADFIRALNDNKLSLDKLGLPIRRIQTSGKELQKDSLQKRIDNAQVYEVIELQNTTLALLKADSVGMYSLDWTPSIYSFTDTLIQSGFKLNNESFEIVSQNVTGGITLDSILTILTIVGFVFLGFIIFRSAQASGMGIMQFGQSKAKMFFGQKPEVTFKDVAGIDEAREELNEIVDFLKNPNKYRKLGARIPKGILMFGPPGTGKTLLARAIAGEAGVPFFHTSGSEFEEMLVGAGASRVRDLFAKAKKAAPALIFIDEIDAVARKRGTRIQSGSTEQTLNQILVEMDGFEKNLNVIVIAATNRPDVLDPAILRPGRFDRQVRIDSPDKDGRFEILQIHSKNKPLASDVDLEKIAKRTVGFTGADLENIMNESAIIAAKDNRKEITAHDIEEAVSKVVLGPAKKSRKRTDEELNLVAYHEAGHALVAKLTTGSIPVDKISIVSRGSSGGVTMFLPDKDENIVSMKRLLANIRVSLGGRAAEQVVLKDISTGASNDIEKATKTARGMIQSYGMSKDLGLVQYGQSQDSEYLGYNYGDGKDYSEKTAEMIDSEVRSIIANEYKEAVKIVEENKDMLDKIAKLLLDKEVVEKDEFEKLFEK